MKFFSKILRLVDPRRPASAGAAAWVAAITLALDQATKLAAVLWLAQYRYVVVIPNLLNLSYATNTGAAFSAFTGHVGALTVVRAVVSVGLAAWIWKLPPGEQGLRPVLGLILGGAIGNLIDSVCLGHVIDFIQAHWFWKAFWPTFNVADSAVCVGMTLLVVASFRGSGTGTETETPPPGAKATSKAPARPAVDDQSR
jgi:signal peptidase II